MKKIILAIAAVAVAAGAYAQNDSLNRTMNQRDNTNINQNQNWQNHQDGDRFQSDGVVMRNGKMMKLKNGQMTSLQDNDMTLSNGTKIMSDGTCIHKDGTKTTMTEGQHMDMSGNLNRMEAINRDFNQNRQNNPQGLSNNQNQNWQNHQDGDRFQSDGVVMRNGKMMKVKNGQMTILQENDSLSNGTRFKSDGTWTKKDGSTMKMTEGQHMDMSGNLNRMEANYDGNRDFNQNSCDGVFMLNGKMLKTKNGQTTNLQDNEITMSNGTKIMSDGTWISKDGKRTRMEEGQRMDMSGNLNTSDTNFDRNRELNQNRDNLNQNRDNLNQNRDLNQNRQNNDESYSDGVFMQNGKLMQVKNGQTTTWNDNELTMTNGTRILRDGTWIKSDGTRTRMEEGQHIDMSGKLNSRDTNTDNNMYLVPNNKKNEIK